MQDKIKPKEVKQLDKKEYDKLVKKMSPGTNVFATCIKAFLFGGSICTVGEMFRNLYLYFGAEEKLAATLVSVTMIFIGALLTGIGVYDDLAKHGGAGTSVPITGFANAIVSPALEYKSEGYVLGVGAKMFVIAGPVLVYGTLSSAVVGIIYFLMKML